MKVLLMVFTLIVFNMSLLAQTNSDASWSATQLGMVFKFKHQREIAIKGVAICQSNIEKATEIIQSAQKSNRQDIVEMALRALQNSQAAKVRYGKLQLQIEKNIAYIENKTNDKLGLPKITGIVANHVGRVDINSQSTDGSAISAGEGYIREGDMITTYDNSSAQINCLDGRGDINITANSMVKIDKQDDNNEALSLLKGTMDIAIDKAEKFAQYVDEFANDPKGFTNEEVAILKEKLAKRFEVRTPAAVLAVRGTKFSVWLDEAKNTHIKMTEGVVEITNKKTFKHSFVHAGEEMMIEQNGSVILY